MNPCIGCGLTLPPGSSHADVSDCVEALKHALERATACRDCGEHVKVIAHPACLARMGAQAGARAGVSIAERKITDAVTRFLGGEQEQDPDATQGPDAPPRGKRWNG